jgi:hypothetical protein
MQYLLVLTNDHTQVGACRRSCSLDKSEKLSLCKRQFGLIWNLYRAADTYYNLNLPTWLQCICSDEKESRRLTRYDL